jgi:hypothetical protein
MATCAVLVMLQWTISAGICTADSLDTKTISSQLRARIRPR